MSESFKELVKILFSNVVLAIKCGVRRQLVFADEVNS